MNPNFIRILEAITAYEVECVLAGGIAANFHGSAIATFDCDVVVSLDSENLIKLAKALSPFAPTFRHKLPPQIFDEPAAARGDRENISLDTSSGVLDCLGDIKGLGDYTACRDRSVEMDMGDFSVRALSRDALIAAKKAMGRPKDLQTVAQLEIGGDLERE